MNSRRAFLQNATLAAAGLGLPRLAWPSQTSPGLKDLSRRTGRLIGAVVDRWHMEEPAMLALILRNFNLITLGKLKWSFLRPSPTAFDFTESDWMADCCRTHGLAMHGHNLCWNTANPDWLVKEVNTRNAATLLSEHIHKVVARYAGQVTSWDVVNEPIAPWMGRKDGLYKGPWLDALGEPYIDIAFKATAAADPAALRVLNVAHVEEDGNGSDQVRARTLELVRRLLGRGVPIQAVGFESHLPATYPIAPTASRSQFVAELRDMGLQILVTECDVDDSQVRGEITTRDAVVAQCYRSYLTAILRQAEPNRVIFFCPTDKHNWYDALPSGARSDGQAHRPGLFDSRLAQKPAYSAVASVLGSIA